MAGYTRTPGQAVPATLKSGVAAKQDGLVMALETDGTVNLATNTALPYGILNQSTKKSAEYGVGVTAYREGGPIALLRSGQAKIPVANGNVAIKKGDELAVKAGNNGKVDKSAAAASITTVTNVLTELARRDNTVGIAEEDIPAGTSEAPGKSHVLTSLKIRGGIGP